LLVRQRAGLRGEKGERRFAAEVEYDSTWADEKLAFHTYVLNGGDLVWQRQVGQKVPRLSAHSTRVHASRNQWPARTRYRDGDLTPLPEKPLQAPQPQSGGLADGPTMVWLERDLHVGQTPGALQGDDVQLEYYEDGFPNYQHVSTDGVSPNHLRRRLRYKRKPGVIRA
jgi:hypothetical protein